MPEDDDQPQYLTSEDPNYIASCEALEHITMAWNDEIEFAKHIANRRQHQLMSIAFVVGAAGLFLGFLVQKDTPKPNNWVKSFSVISSAFLFFAINKTLTSHYYWLAILDEFKLWVSDRTQLNFPRPWVSIKVLWAPVQFIKIYLESRDIVNSRASRSLIEDDEPDLWLSLDDPAEVVYSRTERVWAAYSLLTERNDLCKIRIKRANRMFQWSVLTGFIGALMYLWTI